MQITSYNRMLADGTLETDTLGMPVIYSMGGAADSRIPDDAANISTKDVGPDGTIDASQYYAQAEASAAAWAAMLANNPV